MAILSRDKFQFVATILGCATCFGVSAATLRVPQDFPTIQSAADFAQAGDTVAVSAGEYFEAVFIKAGVSLVGSGVDETFIDGEGVGDATGSVISISSDSLVSDLTVRNSNLEPFDNLGACINARFVSNTVVRRTRLTDCRGAYVGVAIAETNRRIENSLILNSTFGIVVTTGLDSVIQNNTVVGNIRGIQINGGSFSGFTTVRNNIVVANQEGVRGSAIGTIRHNDVFDNGTNYGFFAQDLTGIDGNISADPLFVDAGAGNFTLQPGSPAIDAGDPLGPDDPDGSIADMGAFPTGLSIDSDGDGIEDSIDGTFNGAFTDESAVFSNDFTDQHLAGQTRGTIVVRGDNAPSVTDDNDDGVLLSSSGTGLSLVELCGPSNIDKFFMPLIDANEVVVTCGSLTAEVILGPITMTVGVNVEITIPTGAKAFIEQLPGSLVSVSNIGGPGTPDIGVEVDGNVNNVGPGDPPFVGNIDDGIVDAPSDVTGRAKSGKVNLLWTAVAEADSYDVYRSAVSGGPYVLVGSVGGNVFLDTNIVTGETYFYVVRSRDGVNESSDSDEVEVNVSARRRR